MVNKVAAFPLNCDQDGDSDNDSVPDEQDNCPDVPKADQANFDEDGAGDACDPDIDGDGIFNNSDDCPFTPLGAPVNNVTVLSDLLPLPSLRPT